MSEFAPGSEEELLDVLWSRLGPKIEPANRPLALQVLRRRLLRRGSENPVPDPDIAALFELVGADVSELNELSADVGRLLEREPASRVLRDALPPVFQSYVRAVGRIVAAEAALARALLASAPPAQQAAVMHRALDTLLPLASRGFDALHRALLLEALVETLAAPGPNENGGAAIAMVDVVRSTDYLARSSPGELEHLVDALFEAGQKATGHRPVHVIKYVGDGLFIGGRDATHVADAALQVLAHLEAGLPLRARAGLAHGPVVERAGDVFGLPINLAHHLTKSARPGALLATEAAAALLPASRRGRYRTLEQAHPALRGTRVATIRA